MAVKSSKGLAKRAGGNVSIKSGGTTVRVGSAPHRGRAGKNSPGKISGGKGRLTV